MRTGAVPVSRPPKHRATAEERRDKNGKDKDKERTRNREMTQQTIGCAMTKAPADRGGNLYRRTILLAAIRISANVIMLAAVCLAMYMSSLHPSESLSVFCQYFFGITVVTWVAAKYGCEYVRKAYADADESLVRLPGQRKARLVRWKVAGENVSLRRASRLA